MGEYLYAENAAAAGHSETGQYHASSIGAVCPSGHNTDSSQVRFGGELIIGGILGQWKSGLRGGPAVAAPNLSPIGLDLYVVEEEYLNDEDNLFSNSEAGG